MTDIIIGHINNLQQKEQESIEQIKKIILQRDVVSKTTQQLSELKKEIKQRLLILESFQSDLHNASQRISKYIMDNPENVENNFKILEQELCNNCIIETAINKKIEIIRFNIMNDIDDIKNIQTLIFDKQNNTQKIETIYNQITKIIKKQQNNDTKWYNLLQNIIDMQNIDPEQKEDFPNESNIIVNKIKNLQQKIQNSIRKIEKNISKVFSNQDISQNTNENQDILIKIKLIIGMLLDLQTIVKKQFLYAENYQKEFSLVPARVLRYIAKYPESVKVNNNKQFFMQEICNNGKIGEQIKTEIQQVQKSLKEDSGIVITIINNMIKIQNQLSENKNQSNYEQIKKPNNQINENKMQIMSNKDKTKY